MMQPRRLYMDNAATSFPKPPAVIAAMVRYANELGASPGRGGYAEAIEAGQMIGQCRQAIAQLIGAADSSSVVFTLNCTDALNMAIKGLIDPGVGGHVICTCGDHNSVLRPITAMEDRGWITQTRVEVDRITGRVDAEAVRRAIRPDTRLIALTHVSNVTGCVQPVRAIGSIAREAGIPLVVDAAQSIGHLPIDVLADQIDLLAAPGHKALLGPSGTGFLYVSPSVAGRLQPLREGGTGSMSESPRQPTTMPDRFESGSANAVGIAGLLEGVRWVSAQTIEKLARHQRDLVCAFLDGLEDVPGVSIYGARSVRERVGVFSVRVAGMTVPQLADALERELGILTRAGLHCAPLMHQAIGTSAGEGGGGGEGGGTVRFSFGPFLQPQDVSYAADALAQLADRASRGTGARESAINFAEQRVGDQIGARQV